MDNTARGNKKLCPQGRFIKNTKRKRARAIKAQIFVSVFIFLFRSKVNRPTTATGQKKKSLST
jgi:hypothetical protein